MDIIEGTAKSTAKRTETKAARKQSLVSKHRFFPEEPLSTFAALAFLFGICMVMVLIGWGIWAAAVYAVYTVFKAILDRKLGVTISSAHHASAKDKVLAASLEREVNARLEALGYPHDVTVVVNTNRDASGWQAQRVGWGSLLVIYVTPDALNGNWENLCGRATEYCATLQHSHLVNWIYPLRRFDACAAMVTATILAGVGIPAFLAVAASAAVFCTVIALIRAVALLHLRRAERLV